MTTPTRYALAILAALLSLPAAAAPPTTKAEAVARIDAIQRARAAGETFSNELLDFINRAQTQAPSLQRDLLTCAINARSDQDGFVRHLESIRAHDAVSVDTMDELTADAAGADQRLHDCVGIVAPEMSDALAAKFHP